MIVDALRLRSFRSFDTFSADFCPGINVLWGDNAQGKTTLLEAIAYLSACRSHRARYDRELIAFDADTAEICASVQSRSRVFRLEATLNRNGRRRLVSNGVRLKSAAELGGILNTVLFCPEDLNLIRAGAAERRRFLDDAICQLRPRYAAALAEYKRLHEQKTRILKDWREKPDLLAPLDEYNLRMCQTGALIVHYRAHFIRRMNDFAPSIHREFSGGRETLRLAYQTVKTVEDALAPTQTIYDRLSAHMAAHRQAEIESGACLSGPHKDDLLFTINDLPCRLYASQGQTRTAALSLELAERELFREQDGEYPVLLLDDVLSELDARRQEFVLNRITGGQVFITCCEREKLESLAAGKTLHVVKGQENS